MNEQQRINAVASSSNPSSAVSSKKYDVFLSFRGEDTRLNFTSHLHNALTEAKIETFIDKRLEKGDEISPTLITAIEDSHISVVIFSENYASSKWCLNELSKIMEFKKEKGQIVIPVFYNVDPSHVRHQTGSYKKAFAKHKRQLMCSKWKAALTEAANLAGFDSRNRIESELLTDIVREVLKRLAPTYPNQCKRLVGIEKSYKDIESLLKIGSSEVITLGIWGMGGIGKTTLANALYDKLCYDFEGRCFLSNIREKSDKLEDLCNELFSTLLAEKKSQFDSFDMSRLRRKKIFIVLDDVSSSEQLEKLIADYNFLGAGSRMIVTTRDKQILTTINEIYPVEKLNSDYSLQLFCLTVFGEKEAKPGYEDLSKRVISYCKGVPLALKVLGASLRERDKEEWESELKKLEKVPHMKIHNVLKLSYDGLDRKDIFLDIACFFKGEERARVTRILEAFGFFPTSGIKTLLDKALITISYANQIEMHDLIQEMGQEIIYQESEKCPGKRSRLWKHEEVLDILKYNKGTDVVEGIIFDLSKLNENLYLSSDSLAKMTNLRFLELCGCPSNKFDVYLRTGLESLFNKLRYLRWNRCCLQSLPPNFCAEQLVELVMCHGEFKKLWDGVQNLVNLKTIDLSYSKNLIKIPDLSKAGKLEKVSLNDCESLLWLHPSMLSLPKLTHLYLSRCRKIKSLESNIHSRSLNVLRLNGCSSLEKFSVTSAKMTDLDLSNTAICALSSSIGHLLSLEKLDLRGTNVESLPANIKNLSMLTSLWLNDCKKLVSLPELPPSLIKLYLNNCKKLVSLVELPQSLIELYLNNCKKLVSLPKLPPFLREFPINNCQKLVSLPELPPSVKEVSAFNCISLKTDMTQGQVLQHMSQSRIPYLHQQYLNDPKFCCSDCFIFPGDHVPNECGFHTADSFITLSYPPKSDLVGFICCIFFPKERDLDVSDDDGSDDDGWKIDVWQNPDWRDNVWIVDGWIDNLLIYIYQDGIEVGRKNIYMRSHSKLIADHMFFFYVNMSRFGRTSEVHDQLSIIKFIFEFEDSKRSIKGCGVYPVYATASGLKLVNDCGSLRQFHPSMLSLPNLKYLCLSSCRKIESNKGNGHSKSFGVFRLDGCPSFKEFLVTPEEMASLPSSETAICALSSSIGDLLSLEELDLSGNNVESLPTNIKNFSMLTWLRLDGCKKLMSLPELPPSLRELYLNDCWKLVSLPELPPSLRELYLINCWTLMSLPKLPPSLKEVSAFNCISLETDITPGQVLQHISQSRIPYLHEQYLNNPKFRALDYFIFPGDHVTTECGFHATDSLITISYLPRSDLLGFICSIFFSEEPDLDVSDDDGWKDDVSDDNGWEDDGRIDNVLIYIYQDGIEVSRENMPMQYPNKLIADHVFFFYVNMSRFGRTSDVYDQLSIIKFVFEFKYHKGWIKGCGVFPVYSRTSGLELVNSSTKCDDEPLWLV